MALYLVSYDIPEKNRNEYEELWNYLDSLGSVKILFSEYAVPFRGQAIDLANLIEAHLKKGDRLLVCELFHSSVTAWANLKITKEEFVQLLSSHARTLN